MVQNDHWLFSERPLATTQSRKNRSALNLLRPPEKGIDQLRAQLYFSGQIKAEIENLMAKYGMEQSAIIRMLIVDGLESRKEWTYGEGKRGLG
jgi:hypothetical protein